VLHNLATLRAALNAAKPMFGIDVSGVSVSEAIAALQRTGHVAKSEQRCRRPTETELSALKSEFERIAAYPSTFIPMAVFIQLAVVLPRRLGELCDMQWADYTGKQQILRDTKHPSRPRTENIPVPPKAKAIIDALPRVDARILPYKSESVSAAFQRACERLGIEDLHFHDLRHEGITRLFESGLAIEDVAMISGHQSWNMLRRYTHLKPSDVLEKMQ
jgi:integrase